MAIQRLRVAYCQLEELIESENTMLYNLEYAFKLMDKYKIDALLSTDSLGTLKYLGFNIWFASIRDWMLNPGGSNNNGLINFCLLPYKKSPIFILLSNNISFLNNLNKERVIVFSPFTDINTKSLKRSNKKNY